MNHSDQDRLLNQILTGEELEALRQRSLDRGIASLTQRRRQRALRKGLLACLPLLFASTLLLWRSPDGKHSAVPPTRAVGSNAHTQSPAPVKTITDEELFAMFPNRPMALVGKPGHQEVVFLDQPRSLLQSKN